MRYFLKLALNLFMDELQHNHILLDEVQFSQDDKDKKAICIIVPWVTN